MSHSVLRVWDACRLMGLGMGDGEAYSTTTVQIKRWFVGMDMNMMCCWPIAYVYPLLCAGVQFVGTEG